MSLDNIFEDSLNAANPQLVDSFEMGEEHPKVQLSDHLAGTDKIASKASQQVIEILEAVDKGAECSMVELLDELCRKKGRPSEKVSTDLIPLICLFFLDVLRRLETEDDSYLAAEQFH